jgi:polyhydroxyalkanoic acid synthase PhaR subunit
MTDRPNQEASLPDPFELWRHYYEANEQAWTKAMKDVITTPGYAEAQGKMLETFLSFQKIMRDSMTAQLGALNIASREDVTRLGELITGLEEKIDQLDDRMRQLEKQIPVDLARRLEAIDAKLAGLERAPSRPAPARPAPATPPPDTGAKPTGPSGE